MKAVSIERQAMIKPNGVHHIAIMTADIKAQIAYFTDVLGCKLSAIFDMHGVPGAFHAFVHLNDHSYFSFVQMDDVADIPATIGITHAGTGAGKAAAGVMQHLAFNVDSEADLLAMRDRIRTKGINVMGPIDHGVCKSIYFAGPEGLTLEVASSDTEMDQARWIDPKVLERVGISADEAARFKSPDTYTGEGGQVKQPPIDPAKPHQAYPPEMYQALMAMPDEVLGKMISYTEPPVPAV
jgi:catechol 2,3-dioxygenase-like lactoylglutathione lyase family enzyme